MHWNYRVWLVESKHCDAADFYVVKETYYNEDDDICGCTENNVEASGDTLEDLVENLRRIADACNKPVLVEAGFEFAPWYKDDELTKEENNE